jgi:hypothetical protein
MSHTQFAQGHYAQGLYTANGALPYCHEIGPFSCRKPSSEEQPGPPFNQIVISSVELTFSDGKNQKYNSEVSLVLSLMGRRPA